jgi:glycosyltransferase involved in cell wall biosynthesis
MKIALVASSYLPTRGALERHVDQLARGLARRGAEVEILTQGATRGTQRHAELDGVIVRRFPTSVGPLRFAVAPGLWDRMRLVADEFDLADVHCTHAPFALAVARAGFRRQVFTPHAPVQRLVGWPYFRATRTVVAGAAQIVCTSRVERDLLCGRFPLAARRTRVVPTGVDTAAIGAASSFARSGSMVLTVGRLERAKRIDRAIAAMAGLGPEFRLVVVGDGPDRHRLQAYAADLKVSSRVAFVGAVPDEELYRWLRTADVVVALPEQHSSGLQVTEALAAGASVVASDVPVHHEAAARLPDERVFFVSAVGSPLEVADAITDAAAVGVHTAIPAADSPIPSWDSVVNSMWSLYETVAFGAQTVAEDGDGDGTSELAVPAQAMVHTANDMTVRG